MTRRAMATMLDARSAARHNFRTRRGTADAPRGALKGVCQRWREAEFPGKWGHGTHHTDRAFAPGGGGDRGWPSRTGAGRLPGIADGVSPRAAGAADAWPDLPGAAQAPRGAGHPRPRAGGRPGGCTRLLRPRAGASDAWRRCRGAGVVSPRL